MSKKKRIQRIERRLARIDRRLGAIQEVDAEPGLRGRLFEWVAGVASDEDIDANEDGEVSFEELVDAAIERADELLALDGFGETLTDFSLALLGEVAVLIYERREARLKRRKKRLQRRLERLRAE